VKNPFKRNILLLAFLIIIWTFALTIKCNCNESCCSSFHFSTTIENILIGLLSSSILLLLMELFQMLSDKWLYGYLEGQYERTIITQVLGNNDIAKGGTRTENLSDSQKKEFHEIGGLRPIPGSRYAEIISYSEIGKNWRIKLRYNYHGIYLGTAEYHNYNGQYGDSTIVKFNLALNLSNPTTGSGNYKYREIDDYGTYSFQVNADDKTEILVEYKNTIPSGLAEGYEKWKRINTSY
jgi:hypothetical protein